MQVRILGAHCQQSRDARPVSILIDGTLCIDAGSLTTALTFEEQRQVKAILLTHRHFDHVQGIPTFAINTASSGPAGVYGLPEVLDEVRAHLVNGTIYPTFTEAGSYGGPSLAFYPLGPNVEAEVAGYRVLPLPVQHGVPALGYQVTASDGAAVFYTGDTYGQLRDAWKRVSPRLLIAEVTFPNSWRGKAKHMAPADLEDELRAYLEVRGAIPRVLVVHMVPWLEGEVRQEVAGVARRLGVPITLAHEDMAIEL